MSGPKRGGAKRGGAQWADPLSRPVVAASISAVGEDVAVRLSDAEREALAEALDLEAVPQLAATYHLARRAGGIIKVDGRLKGVVRPYCVVSLEPFDLAIDEPVELRFIEPQANTRRRAAEVDLTAEADDAPDPVENGMIDLGRVTTEFLSLAIPPFPKRPGVESVTEDEAPVEESPFAALRDKLGKPGNKA